MEDIPDRRFVRLSLPDPDAASATFTLLAADPDNPPSADGNEIVAGIATTDGARAQLIAAALRTLLARENELFEWLEADARNTILFTRDPAAALRAALPDLDADFFSGWSGPA